MPPFELIGDSARGDEYGFVRLLVDGDRIVDADAPGLERPLAGLTLLEAAAVRGDDLAADALANAIGPGLHGRSRRRPGGGRDERRRRQRRRAPAGGAARGRRDAAAVARPVRRRAPSASAARPHAVIAARETCHRLGLPHVTLDLREQFRAPSCSRSSTGYAAGLTPNPCMRCNGRFRFDELVAFAAAPGATAWTGHYARIVERDGVRLIAPRPRRRARTRATCSRRVDPALLDRVWFPLGEQGRSRRATRRPRRASPSRARAESQEACFLARRRLPRLPRAAGPRASPGRDRRRGGAVELGLTTASGATRPASGAGSASPRLEPLYASRADAATNTWSSARARRSPAAGSRCAGACTCARAGRGEASLPLAGRRERRSSTERRLRAQLDEPATASRRARSPFSTTTTPWSEPASSVAAAGKISRDATLASRARRRRLLRAAVFLIAIGLALGYMLFRLGQHVRAPLVLHPRHRAGAAAGDRQDRRHGRPGQPRARQARHGHRQRRSRRTAPTRRYARSRRDPKPVEKVPASRRPGHGFRTSAVEGLRGGDDCGAEAARSARKTSTRPAGRQTRWRRAPASSRDEAQPKPDPWPRPGPCEPKPAPSRRRRRPPAGGGAAADRGELPMPPTGRRLLGRAGTAARTAGPPSDPRPGGRAPVAPAAADWLATAWPAADPDARSLMRTTAELREGFLASSRSNGHLRVPSRSLIPPADDPSTLFIVAGMQPLKPYFLGAPTSRRRSASSASQKVLRAGGKDTDLDDVGSTARHCSFFEMLGNFSFGDYFKDGADRPRLGVRHRADGARPDRLWATVFAGDPELGLGEDDVAVEGGSTSACRASGSSAAALGELLAGRRRPGPCGPCSEIFYDRGEEHGCGDPDCAPELRALRALPRVLEPRLHGVRPAAGRRR